MRKAIVAITPQVWYAWWNCSSLGYIIAASMMIHQPVKNCTRVQCQRNNISSGITGYKKLNKIYWHTRTPAAMEAIVFLFSLQSTLHSQSPHLIPSRNPDILLIWPDPTRQRNTCYFWHVLLGFIIKDYSHFLMMQSICHTVTDLAEKLFLISNIAFWNNFLTMI